MAYHKRKKSTQPKDPQYVVDTKAAIIRSNKVMEIVSETATMPTLELILKEAARGALDPNNDPKIKLEYLKLAQRALADEQRLTVMGGAKSALDIGQAKIIAALGEHYGFPTDNQKSELSDAEIQAILDPLSPPEEGNDDGN